MQAPPATANMERIIRFRSSSRCCSRPMEPMRDSSCFSSGSATISGIVILREVFDALGQPADRTGNGVVGLFQDFSDRSNRLACIFFQINLPDFFVNLVLKVSAGTPELSHEFAYLAGNLRQLLWPKHDQGQQHDEENFS